MDKSCLDFVLKMIWRTCWEIFLSVVNKWNVIYWWLFLHLQGYFWECLTICSLPALFFFEVEISLHTLIPLFMPWSVHSGSVSWDYWGWMFPDKLCLSSFQDRLPHYAWTAALPAQALPAHSDFVGSRVSVFRCNLPPALLAEMFGVFYMPLK